MNQTSSRRKLIAFISNSAWSVYNFRLDVIRYLLQNEFDILVMAPDDEYSQLLIEEGCQYACINFSNKTENPLQDFYLYNKFKKLYAQHRPDLIFHYVIKPNIYGSLAAGRYNIPSVAVITGLGYPFAKRNWLYSLVKGLYKRALRKVTEVWFLNNEDAKVFISENIINIAKAKVLPGEGVNTDFFTPSFSSPLEKNGHFIFLMSCRLLKSKGIGVYADAARILQRKNIDARFELIGFFEKNHPDSIVPDDLERWQKDGLIHYNGFAKDVRYYLKNADCFVFPSFYNEGIPRGLMEAASMELPIITSFNRGCKEVVLNNSNGYVCTPHDPFDLADKMERMMNLSAEERNLMGKNGRQLVIKKFNIQKIIVEYERMISKLFND